MTDGARKVLVARRLLDLFAPTCEAYGLAGPETAVRQFLIAHSPATPIDPDRHEEPFSTSIRMPLTPELVVVAFTAHLALSVGWGVPAARSAAFDVDRPDGTTVALRIAQVLGEHGLEPVIVPSEGGRAHLWIVVAGEEAPVPAVAWRCALRATVALARIEDTVGIELRPSTDRPVGSPFAGSTLRLPGSPHRRTGRAWPWLDASGQSMGASLDELVAAVPTGTSEAIISLAELAPSPGPAPSQSTVLPGDRTARYLAAALVGLVGDVEAAGPGDRNRMTFAAAARARRLGIPAEVSVPELVGAAIGSGLPEREARAAVRSGYREPVR